MIYLITCKNDFPPVNEFTICAHDDWLYLPYETGGYWRQNQEKIVKIRKIRKDMLGFACSAQDPVEAMIKFWAKYMYRVDISEKERIRNETSN